MHETREEVLSFQYYRKLNINSQQNKNNMLIIFYIRVIMKQKLSISGRDFIHMV